MACAVSRNARMVLSVKRGRFGKQRILRAHVVVLARQAVHRGGFERLGAVALDVAQRHEDFQRLVLDRLRHRPNSASSTSSGSFQPGAALVSLASYLPCGMIDEQVLPHVQTAGQVRLAVGIQAQARGQQQHVGVGAEHGARRAGTGDASANGRVEALQALRIGEIILAPDR